MLRDVLSRTVKICGIQGQSGGRTKYIFSSPIIKNPQYYQETIFSGMFIPNAFHEEIQYSPVEKNIHVIVKGQSAFDYFVLQDRSMQRSYNEDLAHIGTKPANDSGPEPRSSDIAAILSTNQPGGSILYTTSPVEAHQYAYELASRIETNENRLSGPDFADLKKYIKDHYDDSFGIAELISKGVGVHYGPMPLGLRRAIVNLFEQGKIQYLVCTSTLLEGVNLPAKNIYLFSADHTGEKHSALSFWNLVGRAGRITYGLSGNVFLITKDRQEYSSLIEDTQAEITDPELDVVASETRRTHIVASFLDENKTFAYTKSPKRDDIEYLIFELLKSNNPGQLLDRLGLEVGEVSAIMQAIENHKGAITLPWEIIDTNPGLDPRLQDDLFRYLSDLPPIELAGFFASIENPRRLSGAILKPILEATALALHWPPFPGTLANRIAQWSFGLSLSGFIQQTIKHVKPTAGKDIHIERIRVAIKVLKMLETEISFKTPKYLKTFFEIALFVLSRRGADTNMINSLRERLDAFLFAIECGIASSLGKFLFERGVSRTVAITASHLVEHLPHGELTSEFFLRQDVRKILTARLSKVALQEIDDHLV